MNKKYEPKHRQVEPVHHLEGQPGRDHAALILPLSVIRPKDNIRKELHGIEDLAESIKSHGLLQPLVVRKENGGFTLIAGHRRYKALQMIGAKEVPVRFQNVDENEAQILRLIENIQREDLSGAEEIIATAKLLPLFGSNQSELAKALGKSKTYVSRCIKTIEIIGVEKVATSQLSKSALFELADKSNGEAAPKIETVNGFTVRAIRNEGRKSSGPISGGRYVDRVIELTEHGKTGAFSLRVNYSPDLTPMDSKEKIIATLSAVLKRIR